MNELDTAIYARLAADATLAAMLATPTSIFKDVAPEGSALPLIVFNQPAPGSAQDTMRSTKAYERFDYVVQALSEGPDQTIAGTIAARIYTVLQDAPLSVSGFTTLTCRLAGRIAYTENTAGVLIRHAGARYHVEVA